MKIRNLKQSANFKAIPHEVYEMLMDSKKHAQFTGSPAKISRTVGGVFNAHGDYIEGKNVELIPDHKIVQMWRGSNWEKEHYSTVTYELTATKGGTKLTFTQKDIPADDYENIKQGWIDYYWEPMKAMLINK